MAFYNGKAIITKVVYTGNTGGGDLDGLIDGSISGEITSNVTNVKNYAFAYCDNLTRVDLPNATNIGYGAFNDCDGLEEILVPKAETIQMYAFNNLNLGFDLILPNVKSIQSYAFLGCRSRSGNMIFDFTGCKSIPTLAHTNAFDMISSYEIHVPSALYNNWVAATNWSSIADHIVSV